ncbi:MAG: Unknown protein [uncultured Thiotrichaceae bacterium]|uniref:High-affinity zinc uptake system protein ZnuA n=1 Tax=uncultured Thiotrichaceae bacterium TaxID=298394 RepID=A0A6S6TN48_9GAMM|nr:MAG: Unknown protein [uncultured Thiotrichaceae bacterium]
MFTLKKSHIVRLFLWLCLSTIGTQAFAEKQPEILSTILPIHLIAEEIAGEHASAKLLIPATQNIHHYTLKPSALRTIKKADLVIRVSPNMERFLNKTLEGKKVLTWMELKSIHALPARMRHTHNYVHKDAHETETMDATKLDSHLWFNPENARLLIAQIAHELSILDAAHAEAYTKNAQRLQDNIKQTEEHIIKTLGDTTLRYAVFHDAWQYFQDYFGVTAPRTLNIQEGIPPSAKQVKELRGHLLEDNIVCLVASPQSNQALLNALVEGNKTKIVILDPKGAQLPDNHQGYAGLLAYTFEQLKSCKGQSHVH